MESKKQQQINPITMLALMCILIMVINFLFLLLSRNSASTITLLNKELVILDQEQRIISRSADVYDQYKDDIDIVSSVFPSSETILTFIETLEKVSQQISPSSTVKFNSLTPLRDGDSSYLLLTISLKTDIEGLTKFLDEIELLPYMTHVTSINANTPDGFVRPSDIAVGLKVYVQDPFSTK